MDPNSYNQQWSEWKFTVTHSPSVARSFPEVKENVARFFRKGFGSASRMKIDRGRTRRGQVLWLFTVQTEGANATDPQHRAYMQDAVTKFMFNGFGPTTVTALEVKLLAGRPDDGRPADQWLILPRIKSTAELFPPNPPSEEKKDLPPEQTLGMPFIANKNVLFGR